MKIDQFAERTNRMLSFGPAQRRDVESLQNWLDGTGCLAREEAAYLAHQRDLVSLAPVADNAVMQLETWVEDKLIRYCRGFRSVREKYQLLPHANDIKQNSYHDVSIDTTVYIYSGPLIKKSAKALLLFLITLLILMPVIICNIINITSIRIVIVMVSTISYLLILSELTKSKTIELILAAAT